MLELLRYNLFISKLKHPTCILFIFRPGECLMRSASAPDIFPNEIPHLPQAVPLPQRGRQ